MLIKQRTKSWRQPEKIRQYIEIRKVINMPLYCQTLCKWDDNRVLQEKKRKKSVNPACYKQWKYFFKLEGKNKEF